MGRVSLANSGFIVEALERRTLLSAAYTVVDLGVLPGGASSAGYGINSAGEVVGNATVGGGNIHGFKWSGGKISDIGTPGGATTHAYAINAQGDVTGETLVGQSMHAYFYSHGVMHDIGTLGGHTSFAYAINDSDTIVGGSYIKGDKLVHAFIWTPVGGMKDLGTLGGGFSLAYAISSAGKIVGYSTNAHGQNHVFLDDGTMHDLGTLSRASRGIAYAINAVGQIAGSATVSGHESAFLYSDGKSTGLGTLGGTSSEAYGINRSGIVVGLADIKSSSTTTHAFVERAGKMYDLNTQIDPAAGWTLLAATSINDAGDIAGLGMIRGKTHGFLLTPI